MGYEFSGYFGGKEKLGAFGLLFILVVDFIDRRGKWVGSGHFIYNMGLGNFICNMGLSRNLVD